MKINNNITIMEMLIIQMTKEEVLIMPKSQPILLLEFLFFWLQLDWLFMPFIGHALYLLLSKYFSQGRDKSRFY